jgi:hypothetical protein
MTQMPQDTPANSQLSEEAAAEFLKILTYKQGTWVDWGKACQQLKKAGYTPQQIFEDTGFQPSQQNLITVAAQVYESLIKGQVAAEVAEYFQGPRSDVLHEFRVLSQEKRVAAAEFAMEKKLDVDGAHELAKAMKEYAALAKKPESFSAHPGDAMAYQAWQLARKKKELQDRSLLIAKGLKFVHSPTAREEIEKLLTDFTVVSTEKAPLLPVYRLESESDLSQIIPVLLSLSVSPEEFQAVPILEKNGEFQVVNYAGNCSLVSLPGWQVILNLSNPVGIFCESDRLPQPLPGKPETVLVVVDRALCTWNRQSYFLVHNQGRLEIQWLEAAPDFPILGQVMVVLRPKKIFDENAITEPWQMDD